MFGLTGGVASGKSTVAAQFRRRGVPVIDADAVARDVVELGSDGLAAVIAAFGEAVVLDDGSLDRAALGAIVFADADKRALLNGIVHPRIGADTQARIAALEEEGVALACYDAPLLVENGLADAFRPLVVVALDEARQIERMCARDGVEVDVARKRIAAQAPLADKVKLADHVIDNSGSLADLHARADEVLDAVRTAVS